jgi:hypothetical protein
MVHLDPHAHRPPKIVISEPCLPARPTSYARKFSLVLGAQSYLKTQNPFYLLLLFPSSSIGTPDLTHTHLCVEKYVQRKGAYVQSTRIDYFSHGARTDFFLKFDLKTLESKTKPRGETGLTVLAIAKWHIWPWSLFAQ